jgi:acyl-CoA thioester hydrolase
MADGSPTHDFAFSHRLAVRFRDCDAMGHVNHAVYFTYLEQCRIAWWRHLGGSRGLPGADTIIAHAACDYRAPAFAHDELDILLKLGECGTSSFTLLYAIVNAGTAKRVADATTVSVTFDYATGRTVRIPDATRALLQNGRT